MKCKQHEMIDPRWRTWSLNVLRAGTPHCDGGVLFPPRIWKPPPPLVGMVFRLGVPGVEGLKK